MPFIFRPAVLAAILASGCLPDFALPATPPADASGDAGMSAVCAGEGEPCCVPPAAACAQGFRCNPESLCVVEEQRLCVGDDQCHPGQTCCPTGLLGSCVTVEPGGACPLPDLRVVTTQQSLALSREDRVFSPETSAADACAVEKGCVAGAGLRTLMRFSIEIENQGDADLVLGEPGRTPGFELAACDGQPHLESYLRYELVAVSGVPVPGVASTAQARCRELPSGFSSRFDCELYGLWRGFTETHSSSAGDAADDCQWLDITGVPPSDYLLRVQIDPERRLAERSDNNVVDLRVSIPAFDDPLQPCPAVDDPLIGATSSSTRECGWSAAASATSCVPGDSVTLGCPLCLGDPMLRVCGTEPCSAGAALARGDDVYQLIDSLGQAGQTFDSLEACNAEVGAGSFCGYASACPSVTFVCPEGGSYVTMTAAQFIDPAQPATCVVEREQAEGAPDGGL